MDIAISPCFFKDIDGSSKREKAGRGVLGNTY
jgi:hypothetical protein